MTDKLLDMIINPKKHTSGRLKMKKKLVFKGWYIIADNRAKLEALAEQFKEQNKLLHDKLEKIATNISKGINLIRKGLEIKDWWELNEGDG